LKAIHFHWEKFTVMSTFGLAIHGGAGAIAEKELTPELEKAYHAALELALLTGHEILAAKGSSLDAVQAAITLLEDSPLFNAGKGAVFTNAGENELDAAIMDGNTLMAGMVAGVQPIKNPILLARAIMEKSPHVMLVGHGAELFAQEHGFELVPPSYFYTQRQWDKLQRAKQRLAQGHSGEISEDEKHGTVGAVALDQAGNLAAGTSTGGMTNKRVGRVGDSPIIGAGTYANNETCAVSATGHGEYILRLVTGHEISALMAYRQMSLAEAANIVVMEKLVRLGGTGGVIAIDRQGNVAMPFNTQGMYRGYMVNGNPITMIHKN
jgi:beta-aspartyl-peptidase (threonine type)